jgi:hypothetical protein
MAYCEHVGVKRQPDIAGSSECNAGDTASW